MLTRGWSEARQAYAQSFDSDELDAAQLLMPILGFLPATDERMRSTIDAIADELTEDGLVLRYRNEEGLNADGLTGEEGTFVICSFWLVSALAKAGEVDRAEALFDKLVGYANDLGLLAEEIDTANGELLGNFPQAFSHIGLITAAWEIDKARGVDVMTTAAPDRRLQRVRARVRGGPRRRSAAESVLAEVDAHEGPVYFADENALYFTTLPKPGVDGAPSVQIKRLALGRARDDVSVVVGEANARQRDGARSRRRAARLRAGQPAREHARISRLGPRGPASARPSSTAGAACGSTRRTTWSSRATARSGSPTRATATSRASSQSRWSATSSTATTRHRARSTRRRRRVRQAQRHRALAGRAQSCTSPTAAPTRSRAATTSIARTTSRRST